MTEISEAQRKRIRKAQAARQARIDRQIARFLKSAVRVRPSLRNTAFGTVEEFSDPALPEMRLRVETPLPERLQLPAYISDAERREKLKPRPRWFWKRPGLPALELYAREDTPSSAREEIELLNAGDEDTILGAYLTNFRGYSDECYLLEDFPVEQLEELIAQRERRLKECETILPKLSRGDRSLRGDIRELRRSIREMESKLTRYLRWIKRNGLRIKAGRKVAEMRKAA